jgi:hypothetical protein
MYLVRPTLCLLNMHLPAASSCSNLGRSLIVVVLKSAFGGAMLEHELLCGSEGLPMSHIGEPWQSSPSSQQLSWPILQIQQGSVVTGV